MRLVARRRADLGDHDLRAARAAGTHLRAIWRDQANINDIQAPGPGKLPFCDGDRLTRMRLIRIAQVEPGSVGGHFEGQQEVQPLFSGCDVAEEVHFRHVASFSEVVG